MGVKKVPADMKWSYVFAKCINVFDAVKWHRSTFRTNMNRHGIQLLNDVPG